MVSRILVINILLYNYIIMDLIKLKNKEIEELKKKLKNVQRSRLRIKNKLTQTLKELESYKEETIESTWDIN